MPVVCSVAVGVVLVVAGAAKLADRERWAADAQNLGAPRRVVPLLPWFEVALGALLVVQVARRPLSGLAAATFLIFTALIVSVVSRGRRPTCACFGAWSSRPIGALDVVRNGVLVVLAVIGAW